MQKTWKLGNAKERQLEGPYTFYLPTQEIINSLKIGDYVKIIFDIIEPGEDGYSGERMWIKITDIQNNDFIGVLDNQPEYVKDLKLGDIINFKSDNIIQTEIDDDDNIVEKYIGKCIVSNKVFENKQVEYFYRDEPCHTEDSGWVFFEGTESDEYIDDPNNAAVRTLGSVLNIDDSFIHLLDSEVGSIYEKQGDKFIKVEKE